MPKRQRSGDSNPLSSARKGAGSKTGSVDKAERNAQSLWHRKSGAGFHLFVEYYGAQPAGVVVDDADFSRADGKNGGAAATANGNHARGMSRAAKKRRRQKKSAPSSPGNDAPQRQPDPCIVSNAEDSHQTDTSPLLKAFHSSSKYPHLESFVQALSRPLPLTLRFRETHQSTSTELKQILCTEYSDLLAPVSYDPAQSIYQSTPTLCKSNLGKVSPRLKELIVEGSMNGTLARQELGSMLPVTCLRAVGAIRAGAKVLDLCASPGSKTLQALEIVGAPSGGKRGRVIANDVHPKRLDSLRDAVLRSGLPDSLTARVTYTNHDASVFPAPKSGKLFDAIICDVPCGGDGTIRKDKHILPMWSPNISNEIHGLQRKILLRALELVRVGGVVCYSTCSMSPIEDEAVVQSALLGNREYELSEWPKDMLPGFIRRPGVTDWKVGFYDQDNVQEEEDDFGSIAFYDSYEQAVDAGVKDAKATLWPNRVKNEQLHLDRCTRLFPQDHDTGGFFVALIKRMS
ncbi:hypothetical protein ACHAXT_005868 [Thalassiosira profunda]